MYFDISDRIAFLILNGQKEEQRLLRCQGYRPNSIVKWKKETGLEWRTVIKVLKGLQIFDQNRIRGVIHEVITSNPEIFSRENLFIAPFGGEGKSGAVICYEFKHAELVDTTCFRNSSEIVRLPPGSTIVFVDDLIGTGTQSIEYITNKLNLLLSSSHQAVLFTVCATPEGIKKVTDNSNFKVLTGIELNEIEYQHYSDLSVYFSVSEKKKLRAINSLLKASGKFDHDRGLLIAFYYAVPNNSMPIIWKDGYVYTLKSGVKREWFALLPRRNPVIPEGRSLLLE